MRSQLRDHADICGQLVMAPPVEKILRSKEETNPEKLFNMPISKIHIGLHVSCCWPRKWLLFKATCFYNIVFLANMFFVELPDRLARVRRPATRRGKRRILCGRTRTPPIAPVYGAPKHDGATRLRRRRHVQVNTPILMQNYYRVSDNCECILTHNGGCTFFMSTSAIDLQLQVCFPR